MRDSKTNQLTTALIRIDEPIFKIPHLPIHLTLDRNKFEWNNESHLKAVLASTNYNKNSDKSDLTSIDKVKYFFRNLNFRK